MRSNKSNLDMVRQTIEQASKGVLAHPQRFGGVPGKVGDYERQLTQAENAILRHMEQYPREDDESPKRYMARLFDNSPQGRDQQTLLEKAKNDFANIRQLKSGKDDLALLHAEADMVTYRYHARPLVAKITEAADSEALLAKLYAAVDAHLDAQKARQELSPIFSRACVAAATLGQPAPPRPKSLKAHEGAIALASLLTRAASARHARQS